MSKGAPYRLVEAAGCRYLSVPLGLWPALTGMLSDNQYQFEVDCWQTILREVISMQGECLPTRYSFASYTGWEGAGTEIMDSPETPEGTVRRITHIMAVQASTGTADIRLAAYDGTNTVTVIYQAAVPTGVPVVGLVDALFIEGDRVRITATVTAETGTLYLRCWGEEWTL